MALPRPPALLALVGLLLATTVSNADPVPDELARVLDTFRAGGPKGWAFTQTSTGEGKSLVEAFDPLQPEFRRWTLLSRDGKAATDEDQRDYREKLSRRSRGDTAPDVTRQLDRSSCEKVSDDGDRVAYRFRLRPTDDEDTSAEHMAATFHLHRPTGTIERVELGSLGPFSPVFSVKVQEARTRLEYTLPADGRPSLLTRVVLRIRGRALWLKSIDSDLEVVYSDYRYAGKPPAP